MPKYTFARELRTFWYTSVTAESNEEAQRIAYENFDNFEDIEEGDAEWDSFVTDIDEEED